MAYSVTGLGVDEITLRYEKETLEAAADLASKIADQGCQNVKVWDAAGIQVNDQTLRWTRMNW